MSERSLEGLLTREALLESAGSRYFERGEDYFKQGLVERLRALAGVITARVQGTETYEVRIEAAVDGLEFDCTCPLADEGAVCKHCVAVGLAWLENRGAPDEYGAALDGICRHLGGMEKTALIELVMERAKVDDDFFDKLRLASRREKVNDFAESFRLAVDHLTQSDRFIAYHAMRAFSHELEELVGQLSKAARSKPAECIHLAEYFLRGIERKLESIDDSNGFMRPIVEDLEKLHHDACVAAKPDPVALARRLFGWNLHRDWDIFYDAATNYADVFGAEGLAEFRRLAEEEWAKVPTKEPGAKSSFADGTTRIRSIMEDLAEASGDVDALAAVKSRDLSSPYCFLQIAEVYAKAGRQAQALDWAERGLKAFPQNADGRLREFVAEEYSRLKRHEEALALVWANFTVDAGLRAYQALKARAELAGRWPQWRAKAIEWLRRSYEEAKRRKPRSAWFAPSKSELVEIFLWERNADAAWAEAKDGGCRSELWMAVAALREKHYPEDAIAVYRAEVKRGLDATSSSPDYSGVVRLVRKIGELMNRIGRDQEFVSYLNELRTVYKRKRNLMKLLERVKPAAAA